MTATTITYKDYRLLEFAVDTAMFYWRNSKSSRREVEILALKMSQGILQFTDKERRLLRRILVRVLDNPDWLNNLSPVNEVDFPKLRQLCSLISCHVTRVDWDTQETPPTSEGNTEKEATSKNSFLFLTTTAIRSSLAKWR
jgi:hypothetical protein